MYSLSLDAPRPGAARLRLRGHLDDQAARELLHLAADVVKCGCSSLVLDIGELDSFDPDASYAVVGCQRLSAYLPDGVAVVTGSAAGATLADAAGIAAHPAEGHPSDDTAGTMVPCPAC